MPIAPPSSKIVLRVHRPSSDKTVSAKDQVTPIATNGIVLGKGLHANFQLFDEWDVDAAHGTLECTVGLGIWVYSDHSRHGSILNDNQSVHNDAVVVHDGDRLKVGRTEVKLSLEKGKPNPILEKDSEEKRLVSPVSINQDTELSARNVARIARRGSAMAASKLQQAKERLPRIETSGPGFDAVESMTAPPEYTMSPIPGTRSRRKRNPIVKTTTVGARRSLEQHGHVQSFHRPHVCFGQASDIPFTSTYLPPEVENPSKNDHAPPLEYSSSPTVSSSSLAARQRYPLSQQTPTSVPISVYGLKAEVSPQGTWPSSRRDDLRIQVSKKMAAAAPVGAGKANLPFVIPKALEFQPPASPVAQRDLLRQQESLQTILQHKLEEEQLLKQQQEEWMRHNMMSVSFKNNELLSSTRQTPPLSVKNEKRSLDTDLSELVVSPIPALRTHSRGLSQKHILRPSATTQASRARLNSFEERPDESEYHDRKGRRKTTALVLSPNTVRKWKVRSCSFDTEIELSSSDESVVSTASTVVTCHRRVSSLSSSNTSSVGLRNFLGYEEEEDTEDMVTSFTTPEVLWIG